MSSGTTEDLREQLEVELALLLTTEPMTPSIERRISSIYGSLDRLSAEDSDSDSDTETLRIPSQLAGRIFRIGGDNPDDNSANASELASILGVLMGMGSMLGRMQMQMSRGQMEDVPIPLSDEQIAQLEEVTTIDTAEHPICTVCLSEFENPDPSVVYRLPCSHHYHAECIQKWFKLRPNCPCCKQDIRQLLPPPDKETETEDLVDDEPECDPQVLDLD